MQTVGIGQHDHAVPLLTKLVHGVDDLRAKCHKYRLPAVSELLVAQGQIHLVTHGFSEGFIADFPPLMLVKCLSHGEILFQGRQRHTAKIAPCTQHSIKIDIDDDIS